MDPKHRNEPKQTEKIMYWFRETNRKTTGLFRFETKFFFGLFRGHPSSILMMRLRMSPALFKREIELL
jgi:hypothetical protein